MLRTAEWILMKLCIRFLWHYLELIRFWWWSYQNSGRPAGFLDNCQIRCEHHMLRTTRWILMTLCMCILYDIILNWLGFGGGPTKGLVARSDFRIIIKFSCEHHMLRTTGGILMKFCTRILYNIILNWLAFGDGPTQGLIVRPDFRIIVIWCYTIWTQCVEQGP